MSAGKIDVYVHLARGFDARDWERKWADGSLIGMNDRTPYGYGRAASDTLEVAFSEDEPEGAVGKFLRLGLRAALGFDLLHAWRNRRKIAAADVVWTHTESQYLAIALLFVLMPSAHRPKLLGQSVWLFDRWTRYSGLRQAYLRRLIREVDVLTVHSPDNLAVARAAFPEKHIELVLFGIPADEKVPPRPSRSTGPVKVLGLGNDIHRDWATAIAAFGGVENIELTIVSSKAKRSLIGDMRNVRIVSVAANSELFRHFDEATVLIAPLKHNKHASGITVLQEGALRGIPCVATDVGGLKAYFDDECVTYVPEGHSKALRAAVDQLAKDPPRAFRQAVAAQSRMGEGGLSADAYIARHVELTRRLLEKK